MDGLFFLMSVVGIGVVMWWVFRNDGAPPDRPVTGLFAMFTGAELARRRRLRGWISSIVQPARRKSRF